MSAEETAFVGIDASTREKLAKLVRVLSSDKEGERTAAVTAILNTLEGAGLDIHDLAGLVTGAGDNAANKSVATADAYRKGFDRGYREGREDAADEQATDNYPTWFDMAGACTDDTSLQPRDRDFAQQMLWLTARGHKPSAKQGQWLASLYARTQRNNYDAQSRNQSRQRRRSR